MYTENEVKELCLKAYKEGASKPKIKTTEWTVLPEGWFQQNKKK